MDKTQLERTSLEFYHNIAETDYTLCVRGGGNFSKRFYETLAMGRVPLLLDTDCLLPFEEQLPWGHLIVRIPITELSSLPASVSRHYGLVQADGSVADLKYRCRQLWEKWLDFGGFHRQLVRHIVGST